MARIMTIDDDPMICSVLCDFARSLGHQPFAAQRIGEGLARLDEARPDLVFLDVNLPDGDGLAVIPAIRGHHSAPEVIIITGEGSADGAALAIHNGAWDYVRKPLSVEGMQLALNRALQYRSRKQESPAPTLLRRDAIIGSSPALNACLELLGKAAATEVPVLITGETGTGKELFARAIHDNSRRADKSFVVVDCAALPATLVESILFGHEKGTFTGADQMRAGLVSQAHEGTLFLDEVGEMPISVQKTFLRVLQEQRFRPIGGSREKHSNFRLVAATNRNLEKMVAEGTFRQDLLFRLRGINCHLPPLRERGEDVVDLALTQSAKLCRYAQLPTKGFCPDLLETLQKHEWPGNVRELVNVITYAFTQAGAEPILYPIHLPPEIRTKVKVQDMAKDCAEDCDDAVEALQPGPAAPAAVAPASSPPEGSAGGQPRFGDGPLPKLQEARNQAINQLEQQYLRQLLQQCNRDMEQACATSGLSLSQLYRLMRKHKIK